MTAIPKIDSDDIERMISYLMEKYNSGVSFHKSKYIQQDLHIPSKKVAKILERIKETKIAGLIIRKYSQKTWKVDVK